MNLSSIQSLMNMEMALYGGFNMNSNAPSYANGYGMYNQPSFYGYPSGYNYNNAYYYNNSFANNNTIFGQNIPQQYYNQTQGQISQPTTIFQGLSATEQNALIDSYASNLEYDQKLLPAIGSSVAMGAVMLNPCILRHPFKTIGVAIKGDTVNMFKDAKKAGTAMNDLWSKNHYVMEEARRAMNKIELRHKSKFKLGLFKEPFKVDEYKILKDRMEDAIKLNNIDDIAKAAETLNHANVNNGKLPKLWSWIRGKKVASVGSRMKETKVIGESASKLLNFNNMTFRKAFERSGGKLGLAFGALELLLNMGKIKTAFEKDNKTGMKQLGQTTVKAAANTAGWMLGETAAIWGFAKVGATIGTALGPGIGTAIGAIVGMVGGSIGALLFNKGAKAIVGDDVANKLEAEAINFYEKAANFDEDIFFHHDDLKKRFTK